MNLSENMLNIMLGEDADGEYTLGDELAKIEEEILDIDYRYESNRIIYFTAWTDNYVYELINTVFGDKMLLKIKRHPGRSECGAI